MSIWSARSNGRRESAMGVSNGAGSLTRLGGIGAVKADAEGGRGGMLGGNAAVVGGRDPPPPPYPGACVGAVGSTPNGVGGFGSGIAGGLGGVTKIFGGP